MLSLTRRPKIKHAHTRPTDLRSKHQEGGKDNGNNHCIVIIKILQLNVSVLNNMFLFIIVNMGSRDAKRDVLAGLGSHFGSMNLSELS